MNAEQRRTPKNFENESESSSDSTCSSCCNYSDASIPEWDNSIQENGELFFIKCSPITQDIRRCDEETKSTIVRSKSNKFSTFLRKPKFKKSRNITNDSKHGETSSLPKQDHLEEVPNRLIDQSEQSIAVLFLNVANIESNESSTSDTFYYFPEPADKNIVHLIRGALMTLYHLLPKLMSEKLEKYRQHFCTIHIKEEIVHLIFMGEQKGLMVLACPESRCSLFKLKQLGICIKHYLNFKYKSPYDAFSDLSHHTSLNQFFGNLFIKLLSHKFNSTSGEVQNFHPKETRATIRFEEAFIYPRSLRISYDLTSKIHEKLNELEANDFGDLSEDHYGCQRLFVIVGTCLYYKGDLVVNHLHPDDLVDVHSFLRLNDILDLTITSVMESLIVWQEVYLSSYSNENIRSPSSCNKRWFLLIVGKDHSLLVALLESGGCAVSTTKTPRPDELYVDQVQDTLNDILRSGLLDETKQCAKSPSKRNVRRSSCRSANSSTLNLSQVSNGIGDDTFSESVSRTNSSAVSDEILPVLGRRAQRLQQLSNSGSVYTLSQSNLSDSDSSDCDTTGSSHASSSVGSKQFSNNTMCLKTIIHGDDKALFHYVNLRVNRGVILHSMETFTSDVIRECQSIIRNFESSAQDIRTMLMRKKNSSGSRSQRNCLAVKECGVLYEYCNVDNEEEKEVAYWTVGRTFNKPDLGEVYICYDDKTPQNMVEIALRLALTS